MSQKANLVKELNVGSWVAEDEISFLQKYFIKTAVWSRLQADHSDIVLGPKGAGKSALYLLLKSQNANKDVISIEGSNVNGDPIFSKLVNYRVTADEQDLVYFWRLYLLSITIKTLLRSDPSSRVLQSAAAALDAAGLTRFNAGPGEWLVTRIMDWLKRLPTLRLKIPSGPRVDVGLEPPDEPQTDGRQLDTLRIFAELDQYLIGKSRRAWILIDRLDAAFLGPDARELEKKALRALFRVYAELRAFQALRLKLFLRSDIWDTIMSASDEKFQEASRLNTRIVSLQWDEASLVNLLSKRFLQNGPLVDFYKLNRSQVEDNYQRQWNFLNGMLPQQQGMEWVLNRVADGTGQHAPRELLYFFHRLIEHQNFWFSKKHPPLPNGQLFIKDCMEKAMFDMSRDRLQLTLFAEHPHLRTRVKAFENKKAEHTSKTLLNVWELRDETEARKLANELVTVGFFRRQKTSQYEYVIPPLYRPALEIQPGR